AVAGLEDLAAADLLLAAGLVRVAGAAHAAPGRQRELEAAVVAVAGVGGPVAAGLALCEAVHGGRDGRVAVGQVRGDGGGGGGRRRRRRGGRRGRGALASGDDRRSGRRGRGCRGGRRLRRRRRGGRLRRH